jgi:hypothetical protein
VKNLEQKVPAAGLGLLLGVETAGLLDWAISVGVFEGAATPAPVSSFLASAVPLALTLLGAWIAPHTPRPDLVGGVDWSK